MVGVEYLAVLCLCVVRVSVADEPAVVQEVTDFGPHSSNNDPNSLNFTSVQTTEYKIQDETHLEWLAKFLTQRVALSDKITQKCSSDLKLYWQALNNGELWASKMYDSNGKYAHQFLFGNNFWLGSLQQCLELQPPSFNTSFRIAKLHVFLGTHLTPVVREVLLGICQPDTCTLSDSKYILNSQLSHPPNGTNLSVAGLRVVPGENVILKDRKFQALISIIFVVTCLVIMGTSYEYILERKDITKIDVENAGENNVAFENDEIKKGEKTDAANKEQNNNLGEELNQKNKPYENDNKPRKKKGIAAEMLLAFSAISNGRKIFGTSSSDEGSLTSIHGLRFISLLWVVLVHTYLQLFDVAGNKMLRNAVEKSFMFQTVSNATFSVDTFFFISGLLMAYLYDKSAQKRAQSKPDSFVVILMKFLKMMIYRFIRLTPAYLIILGGVQVSMSYIRYTSVFEPKVMDDYNCEHYWWRNILYINNFFPRAEMCMLWSWYMATDTQFFTLSAIILLCTQRRMKLTAGILCGIVACAWCTTGVISYTVEYQAKIEQPFAMFDELYDKPWTRLGPYVVGIGTGWLLSRIGKRSCMPFHAVLVGWIVSGALLISLVYGLGSSGLGVTLSAVYSALGHTAWGLGLAWIVIACHTGHGGIINSLLSARMVFPLSRLTYCAYLAHPLIMFLTGYIMDGSFHLNNGLHVIIFLGNAVASFLLAFLISLGFEVPVVRLLKLLIK